MTVTSVKDPPTTMRKKETRKRKKRNWKETSWLNALIGHIGKSVSKMKAEQQLICLTTKRFQSQMITLMR